MTRTRGTATRWPRPSRRPLLSGRYFATVMMLVWGLCGLSSCSSPRRLVLAFFGAPADTALLKVTVSLDGQPVAEPKELPAGTTSYEFPLPQDLIRPSDGRIAVEVRALTGDSCTAASGLGFASYKEEGAISVDVFLSILPEPTCGLVIKMQGEGGSVRSSDGSIDCPGRCDADLARSSQVTLTVSRGTGGHFLGWTGPCAGTGECTLTVSGPLAVSAVMTTAAVCSRGNVCWQSPAPQGLSLRGLAAQDDTDTWAVGDGGHILHYDGSTWASINGGPGSEPGGGQSSGYYGLFRVSNRELWAVGEQGLAVRGGAGGYTRIDTGTSSWLYAVYGSSDDVWAVGEAGTLLHYDGVAFRSVPLASNSTLYAIAGTSAKDVWAVGHGDKAWHYNGTAWTEFQLGEVGLLTSLWASAPNEVWAAGYDFVNKRGAVWRFDGTTWRKVYNGGLRLSAVWGRSPTDVWVGGEGAAVLHWDGSRWQPYPVDGTGAWLLAASGSTGAGVSFVGDQGAIVRMEAGALKNQTRGATQDLNAIYAVRADDVWMVGAGGTVLRWDGKTLRTQPSGTVDTLRAIWSTPAGDVFIAGDYGTLLQYNGRDLVRAPSGTLADLNTIWGTGPSDVWAGGRGGALVHLTSKGWSVVDSGTTVSLTGLWGSGPTDVYATGEAGVILRYDGATWRPTYTRNGETLRAVWGSGPRDVWTVGDRGQLLHFDGSRWAYDTLPGTETSLLTLLAIRGRGPSDVWVAGQAGLLSHFDGNAWTMVPSGTPTSLTSVALLPGVAEKPGAMWTVGQSGTVLRRNP